MICVVDAVPHWRSASVLEAGAGGALTNALARGCRMHIGSQYLPDVPRGEMRDGTRSEDLESLTIPDASVDLVVTEDVLEHVFRPERAFSEIARVLTSGGAHVFTVPFHADRSETRVRAKVHDDGTIEHIEPPEYHGDPLDPSGVLVVTDFGADLIGLVEKSSGLSTARIDVMELQAGILAPCPVFVSRSTPILE